MDKSSDYSPPDWPIVINKFEVLMLQEVFNTLHTEIKALGLG